jgi:hypothetical protein
MDAKYNEWMNEFFNSNVLVVVITLNAMSYLYSEYYGRF